MRYVKMLGLAAVAVAALMAFVGAGSASATVLCHTTASPCPQKWSKGTEVEWRIQNGTSAEWKTTGGLVLNTCTNGTLKGTVANAGSAGETVNLSIPASGFSWSSCTTGQETLEGGEIEIHAIAGSDNGTLTMKGFRFRTETASFGVCVYTAGTGVDLGSITASGAGESKIHFAVSLPKKEGSILCPADIEWIEHWEQVKPSGTGLFVVSS